MQYRTRARALTNGIRKLLLPNTKLYSVAASTYHRAIFIYETLYLKYRHRSCQILVPTHRFLRKIRENGFKSQYGQDKYAVSLGLIPKQNGYFVDVGCNDPEYLSNSWALEKEFGYEGIAVDPIDANDRFAALRPGTRFINALVSSEVASATFHEVHGSEPWHSMLSGIGSDVDLSSRELDVLVRQVRTIPLSDILRQAGRPVDVLFLDVEGHELSVLQSNDWKSYRPNVIIVENFGDLDRQEQLRHFLQAQKYRLEARIWISDDIFVSYAAE
jgi:FkbM family methyltransferase